MASLIYISVLVFVLNIPFGYWRANVKSYSAQWFLAIHIPVPFIVAFWLLFDLGFHLETYVFMVGAFFLGQRLGAFIMKAVHHRCKQDSSCMVMDLYRCFRTAY